MDDLSRRAVAAALAVSRNLGLHCSDAPEVIADGSNVLVYLVPSPVVARVATTTALVRKPAEQWLALDLDLAGYLAAASPWSRRAGSCLPVSTSTTASPSPSGSSSSTTATTWRVPMK